MGLTIHLVESAGVWQTLFFRVLGLIPIIFLLLLRASSGHPWAAIRIMGWPERVGTLGIVTAFIGSSWPCA